MNEEIQILIQPILDHFGLAVENILAKDRSGIVKDCRHLCVAAVKQHNPEFPLREVARIFGHTHHSTVIHSISEAENMMSQKKELKLLMESLKPVKRKRLLLPDEKVWFNEITFA